VRAHTAKLDPFNRVALTTTSAEEVGGQWNFEALRQANTGLSQNSKLKRITKTTGMLLTLQQITESRHTYEKVMTRTWVRDTTRIKEYFGAYEAERWGAGVETQKNVRGEIGGWGRVPFNETYAPSLSTIYDGA